MCCTYVRCSDTLMTNQTHGTAVALLGPSFVSKEGSCRRDTGESSCLVKIKALLSHLQFTGIETHWTSVCKS